MKAKIQISKNNLNTLENSEEAFAEGGSWERNGGRKQTYIFAKSFIKNIKIPYDTFSLLDLACALGDGAPILKRKYPNARIYGCDFSTTAIKRASILNRNYANFFVSSIDEISSNFDVIYCSNVIEHIENWYSIVEELISFAKITYIIVPYSEKDEFGNDLSLSSGCYHINTFNEYSFDKFKLNNIDVDYKIYTAPGAWGPNKMGRLINRLKRLLGRSNAPDYKQICFIFKKNIYHV